MANGDSLFGQLGFPEVSQEQLIKNRTQQEQLLFQKLVSEQAAALPQQDRGVFQAFANLGRNLLGKPVAELTDKEKQQFAIMQTANQYMREAQAESDWAALEPQEKAFRSQEAIARAAMDAGDIDTYTRVAMDVAQKRMTWRRSQKELEKLGVDIEGGRARTDQTRAQTDIARRGAELAEFDKPGEFMVFDVEGGEPRLVAGTPRAEGGGLYDPASGKSYNRYMTVDQYLKMQDQLADMGENAGVGTRMKGFKDFWTPSGLQKVRDALAVAKTQGDTLLTMGRGLADLRSQGVNPEEAIGMTGKTFKFLDEGVRFAKNMYSGINDAINIGGTMTESGNYEGGKNMSLSEAAKHYDIQVPEGLDIRGEAVSRYQSAVMQLVYMQARLQEPGARQLSDADIQNAMTQLGVGTNNLDAMMSTVMQSYASGLTSAQSSVDQVLTSAREFGIGAGQASRAFLGTANAATFRQDILAEVESAMGDYYKEITGREGPINMGTPEGAQQARDRRAAEAQAPSIDEALQRELEATGYESMDDLINDL